jgi:single-strand DNA-binding protein
MIESTITVQGYVGAEPTLRTAGSHPVANFRVACTPRRLNRATGEWANAPTQWYAVAAWRQLGENVARSLHKGDPVVVHGRLMARSYVNKDGLEVNTFEIEASIVGHDLNRGHSMLTKNDRREQREPTALEQAQSDWGEQPIADPPDAEPATDDQAPVSAA